MDYVNCAWVGFELCRALRADALVWRGCGKLSNETQNFSAQGLPCPEVVQSFCGDAEHPSLSRTGCLSCETPNAAFCELPAKMDKRWWDTSRSEQHNYNHPHSKALIANKKREKQCDNGWESKREVHAVFPVPQALPSTS
ncbi:MAG: hypothetical protein FWD83_07280 [Promicromonosporaceae bacterium]|nr:hypothetical protein [Promicromonosporaceae bacterium]